MARKSTRQGWLVFCGDAHVDFYVLLTDAERRAQWYELSGYRHGVYIKEIRWEFVDNRAAPPCGDMQHYGWTDTKWPCPVCTAIKDKKAL